MSPLQVFNGQEPGSGQYCCKQIENDWAANSRVGMRILAWILSAGKKGFGELSAYFVALAFSRIPIEKLDTPKLHVG